MLNINIIKATWMSLMLISMATTAQARPLSYGICQSACNALVVSCYAAAGFTFGTVTAGAGVPASIVACNTGLGACMAGCVAAGAAPVP